MREANPLSEQRKQYGISAAAHVAGLMALHNQYTQYEQPLPTVSELSLLALREIVEQRDLGSADDLLQ